MDWYQLVKIVHFMGLIALFGFFILYARAGGRVRAAVTTREALPWLELLEVARPMLPSGIVMLAVSGALMGWLRWRGAYPFMAVGLVTALAIWLAWAGVGARHLRAIRAVLGDAEGTIAPRAADVLRDPARWGVMGAINGAALGALVVMTLKLGWVGSIAIVVGGTALVGLGIALTARRTRDALARGRAARSEG